MNIRSLAGVALALSLFLPLGAQAQTLDFSWQLNVGPLNPHQYGANQMFAQSMVYEPLVKYQADGSVAPWLAESWTVSEDGTTYIFKLRPGVSFSNGEPFNAAAVVKNFDTVLANKADHSWLGLVAALEKVEAVDDLTVEIVTKKPYYPMLQELSLVRPVRLPATRPRALLRRSERAPGCFRNRCSASTTCLSATKPIGATSRPLKACR